MTNRRTVSLLLVLILSLPGVAPAQVRPTPSVAVGGIVLPENEEASRKGVEAAAIGAFAEDRRVRVVAAEMIAKWREREQAATAQAPPPEDLRDARDLLAEGKKAYQKLDFGRAVKLLTEARKEFILKLPQLRSNRDLLDAHLYLGVTYIALKERAKGEEELRRVVYLDPKRELSARDFSPSVLEVFAKAKQGVMSTEPVRLRLGSNPSGAEVYLNGRLIGRTPMETHLYSGEYFVLMERKGSTTWYKPVEVAKRTEEIRAELDPDSATLKWGKLFRVREGADQQSRDTDQLQEMAGMVGADLVFLGTVERQRDFRVLGQLYDSRNGNFSQVAMVTAGTEISSVAAVMPDLADALIGFLGPGGTIAGEAAPDLTVPPEGIGIGEAGPQQPFTNVTQPAPKAWYQKWWIYPLIAAVGVGIYFGATELGGAGGSQVAIENEGNY